MASYLVVKSGNQTKSYAAKTSVPAKPYLQVKGGYFPLTTETSNHTGLRVKQGGSVYRIVETYATTTSADTSSTNTYSYDTSSTYEYPHNTSSQEYYYTVSTRWATRESWYNTTTFSLSYEPYTVYDSTAFSGTKSYKWTRSISIGATGKATHSHAFLIGDYANTRFTDVDFGFYVYNNATKSKRYSAGESRIHTQPTSQNTKTSDRNLTFLDKANFSEFTATRTYTNGYAVSNIILSDTYSISNALAGNSSTGSMSGTFTVQEQYSYVDGRYVPVETHTYTSRQSEYQSEYQQYTSSWHPYVETLTGTDYYTTNDRTSTSNYTTSVTTTAE